MNKITNYLVSRSLFIMGAGAVLSIAMLATVASAYTPNILVNENLAVGSRGENVVVLQGLLSELGYLSVPFGVPLGYFGSLTRSALVRYQYAQNVTVQDGYFGQITKGAMRTDFANHGWLTLLGW